MNHYMHKLELYFELRDTPESSRESYRRRIKAFIYFNSQQGKPLEQITEDDIQQYILYLKRERKLSAGTINTYISGIRLFYTLVLDKTWDARKIPRMKRIVKLPVIPPKEDVLSLIDRTENIKHKAFLALIYGSGLRVGEVSQLKIGDICSKTMRVRVERGKHGSSRYTILSVNALVVLRAYFKAYLSHTPYTLDDWLFPGSYAGAPIHVKTIKNTMIKLRNSLKLDSRISAHTLRHCFATHLLEDRVEPVLIQQLLGHKNFKTTTQYLQMTSKSIMGIRSPLDTYMKWPL